MENIFDKIWFYTPISVFTLSSSSSIDGLQRVSNNEYILNDYLDSEKMIKLNCINSSYKSFDLVYPNNIFTNIVKDTNTEESKIFEINFLA